jgi:hypothetical protein
MPQDYTAIADTVVAVDTVTAAAATATVVVVAIVTIVVVVVIVATVVVVAAAAAAAATSTATIVITVVATINFDLSAANGSNKVFFIYIIFRIIRLPVVVNIISRLLTTVTIKANQKVYIMKVLLFQIDVAKKCY